MPGAPASKFCGYFGGAEVQHLASPTCQWEVRVRLCVGEDHLDWVFARRLYDRVLGIAQEAFGSRVQAAGLAEDDADGPGVPGAAASTATEGPAARLT